MCRTAWTALLLWGVLSAAGGEEIQMEKDPIRVRPEAEAAGRARSLLATDVVDLEFRMQDQTQEQTLLTPGGYVSPAQQTRLQTRMTSRLGEGLRLESGLELSLHRQTSFDVNTGEQVAESWMPEYRQRLVHTPWSGAEFSTGQSVALEPSQDSQGAREFWKSSIAYRQTLGQLTEFKLESGYDARAGSKEAAAWDREWAAATFSQGLGVRQLRWKLAGKESAERTLGSAPLDRQVRRQETGLEWQPARQWNFYSGLAAEQEAQTAWAEPEDLHFYEFRSKWSPDPHFDLSGGFSLSSRQEQSTAHSDRSQWHLRGDLRPAPDMHWTTRLQWEMQERRTGGLDSGSRQEKWFMGSGPNIQLDEAARLGAEYGLASERTVRTGGEDSLVEHMLSLVLSAEF